MTSAELLLELERVAEKRRDGPSANDKLPRNWEEMSVTGLWNWLNDPRRFSTPESTVDAIVFAVKQRGIAALKEPATAERLLLCDRTAKQEVDRRVAAIVEART